MKVYIKINKQGLDNNLIPNNLGNFAKLENLDLQETDFLLDKTINHEIGNYYYIFSSLRDKKNNCRTTRQTEEEVEMFQKFINTYNLTTLTTSEMNILLEEEQPIEIKAEDLQAKTDIEDIEWLDFKV